MFPLVLPTSVERPIQVLYASESLTGHMFLMHIGVLFRVYVAVCVRVVCEWVFERLYAAWVFCL